MSLFSSRSLAMGVDLDPPGRYPELRDLAWRFRRAAEEFASVVEKLEQFHPPADSSHRKEMVGLVLRRLDGDLKLMGSQVEMVRSREARRRSYGQRRGRIGRSK